MTTFNNMENTDQLVSLENRILSNANRIRIKVCEMCMIAKSGHINSSLSAVDIISSLYFQDVNLLNNKSSICASDTFILSKGHAAPALYGALAIKGFIGMDSICRFREIDSELQGHPDVLRLPLVGASTGALGQGLSMAIGHALGMQLKKNNSYSYCLIGDGECQEGQIWEAALFASAKGLDNLIVFIDKNKRQSDGLVESHMPLGNLRSKWEAFGWETQEIDGHSISGILIALDRARRQRDRRPKIILAETKKGYISPSLTILNEEHGGLMDATLLSMVKTELGMI